MDWRFDATYTGKLNDEQLETVSDDVWMAHYNSATRVLAVSGAAAADTYREALDAARGWLDQLAGVNSLVAAGRLAGPESVRVQTEAAHTRDWDLLGAAEVAHRLGVSTARVRQLEQREDFPAPVLTLAGGRIYRAADIDGWSAGWDRRPGRPRKDAGTSA